MLKNLRIKDEKGLSRGTIAIAIALAILFIVILVILIGGRKPAPAEQQNPTPDTSTKTEQPKAQDSTKGPTIGGNDYVKEENGLKINTSSKLKENKKLGIFVFSEIRIETDSNGSAVLATVRAESTEKTQGKFVKIKVLNNKGDVVSELGGYIGQIKPGEGIQFRAETATDISNAYDISIEEDKD